MGRRATSEIDLPEVVRIFPLPGTLLLPRGELPLHIFEPRYRAMTAAALADDRLIAMIQPSGEEDAVRPPLFPIGCVGRITEARQTEDGRYFITLTGVTRFRVREELPLMDGYRRVIANYEDFVGDLEEERVEALDRDPLLAALKTYVGAKGLAADWTMVDGLRIEPLVNALSMLCPFAPGEKQALLEATGVAERCRLLTALFEMSAAAPGGGPTMRH